MERSYMPGPRPSFKTKEEYGLLQKLPEDVNFICAYLCFFNPIIFGESAFIRRTKGFDELWIATWDAESDPGYRERDHGNSDLLDEFKYRAGIKSDGTLNEASMNLLYHHLRSTTFQGFPSDFIKAGLLSETNYKLIVDRIKAELDDNATQALAEGNRSSIVQTAKGLRLNPGPNGENPHSWHASCPGTSHPIWIDAEKNIFGCPWCKKKGGPEVLKAFVKERRSKKR